MILDWRDEVIGQLTFWWDNWFWPRLDGLTDDEYFWEPAADSWSIRPHPAGGFTIDWKRPEPDPTPVTTIAWRLGHIGSGIFAVRNAAHFGGPPWDMNSRDWPGSAAAALAWISDGFHGWVDGARTLGDQRLAQPTGLSEGLYGHLPMAGLLLHINREVIHHGAEVCLLRDLYRKS